MSIKGNIFKAISGHLMASLAFETGDAVGNPHNLPALQWVDFNTGQFQNPDTSLGMPMPAVLIRFAAAEYTNLGNNVQDGESIIVFDIGYDNIAHSFEGSEDQDEALKYLQFQEEVYKALQGLQGTTFSPLHRIADEDVDDAPGMLLITRMTFTCIITDTSAEATRNKTLVTDIDTEVQYVDNLPEPDRLSKGFIIPS